MKKNKVLRKCLKFLYFLVGRIKFKSVRIFSDEVHRFFLIEVKCKSSFFDLIYFVNFNSYVTR